MNSSDIASIYQEIAAYEEDLMAITAIREKISESDHDIGLAMTVLGEEPPQEPSQKAFVSSTIGMIEIQVNKPKENNNDAFMWIINESAALRVLAVVHDHIQSEIKKLKEELK